MEQQLKKRPKKAEKTNPSAPVNTELTAPDIGGAVDDIDALLMEGIDEILEDTDRSAATQGKRGKSVGQLISQIRDRCGCGD